MPESPKFLLMHNRKEEALAIVKWIFDTNTRNSKTFNVDGLIAENNDEFIEIKELKGV